jgi:GNAT superfamily N-acetyltransferase
VNDWRQKGTEFNPGVKLHTFQVIPEHLMNGYVNLYNETAQQAPDHDTDESVPLELTSAVDRRETEKLVADRNVIWITIMAEETDGELSGFTEIFQRTGEPFVINQGQTGVLEKYRGRGLGKWLKAEMLDYIGMNLKNAGCIETGNADANAAMVSINERLGFRVHSPHALFSVKI